MDDNGFDTAEVGKGDTILYASGVDQAEVDRWSRTSDLRSYLPEMAAKVYGNEPDASPSAKASNPKDAIGSGKLPVSLVPASAIAEAAKAHLNGALKYGAWNWRKAGVRASIYLDAALRHLYAWQNGEEVDPDDGVPHLAAVLACINIIIDARACHMLTDDRPPAAPIAEEVRQAAGLVERLKVLHADRNPRHWTYADGPAGY